MPKTILTANQLKDVASNEVGFTVTQTHLDELHEVLKVEDYQDAFLDENLRQRLDEWHRKRKFSNRQVDFKSNILEQTSAVAFELILRQLTEERTITKGSDPYVDQQSDQGLSLEQLWDKPVFTEFATKTNTWVRAGSSRIEDCERCRCRGVVDCRTCRGSGRDESSCGRCGGSGDITSVGTNGNHQRERCSRCDGSGRVEKRCIRCHGRGEVECSTCRGSTKVYVYENINAKSILEKEQKKLPVFSTLNPKWLNEVEPNRTLTHTEYDEQKAIDNASNLSIGKQYEINIYEVKRVEFFYKEEREIYLVNEEIFSVETDYLYDKKSIALLVIAILFAIVLFFWLLMIWT